MLNPICKKSNSFTGKEKDEETGYGYFGARYMDHELMTMWLSVDPMSDKYPSMSPYNYCAWNPMKLVDPDGREIENPSFWGKCIVLADKILSKDFRIRYNDLVKSKEIYVINPNDKGTNNFTTDGEKLYINFSLSESEKSEGATNISLLMHETEHAVQFEYGELGFQKDESGEWRPLNFDINDEIKARDVEASCKIHLNAKADQARWGKEGSGLETKVQQIAFLRQRGYTVPDVVWNNRLDDVGKDGTKFALPYRKRAY